MPRDFDGGWAARTPLHTLGFYTSVAAGKGAPVLAVTLLQPARPAAAAACARIVDAGVPMVSQTVLLRGVNDDAEALADLMRAFVETRIRPYYLHHGDHAPGTAHLRTTLAEGQAIMKALRGTVSGLAQPTYVLDIPGGHGKVPVGPNYVSQGPGGSAIEDPDGAVRAYPPTA